MKSREFVLWFEEISIDDVPLVGGKNASLGEMYRSLRKKGVRIPGGFAVTAAAYNHFIGEAGIKNEIKGILKGLDTRNVSDLAERGHRIRDLIRKAEFSQELKEKIAAAYQKLCSEYGRNADVAVRSSATAEDLPDASFAGQQESYLNVRGEHALLEACKKCFSSLFTNRAISYREDKHFDHFKIALSIGVQKMARSDKACSGVMFTLDTESGFRDVVLINASYGLGENIVKGAVNPDQYYIYKKALKEGKQAIISRRVGGKKIRMVYGGDGNQQTKNVTVAAEDRERFCLTDEEVLTLARWGCIIEDYYSEKAGAQKPMDIEWAKDGVQNRLYIVQARPETIHSREDRSSIQRYVLQQKGKLLIEGDSVGEKIGAGKAHILKDSHRIAEFRPGEVLVTDMTDPDWEPIMKMASAIVTNRGGRACHAAIISRELGIPCIVGTNSGTEKIRSGQGITVSCAEGKEGKVYEGILKFKVERISLKDVPKTRTKIMVNIGTPEQAFSQSFLPQSGVGLAREEFIISSYIKVHPLALINFRSLDAETRKEVEKITRHYKDKKKFFIDRLAEGIAMIAAAFSPHDVIVRLSDFKSNEYANLIGGRHFEPKEENPMLGWRGAARYYSQDYRAAFALECLAIKKVREGMGLENVKVMIPMCRTPEEGMKVLKEMERNGLKKGKKGLEVYVMCEVPSNVVLAEQFAEIFDGFSIGSNDLTQMTLGLDRDSALVSHLFDERNDAVKRLVEHVIAIAKQKGKKIGICGQAPSDYPEFAEFLVDCGIDSISLNPDAVMKTLPVIARREAKTFK